MADRARGDLPYGHFGRGIYSLDDHCWYFERELAFSSNTQQLAEAKVLSKLGECTPDVDPEAGPVSKRHQKQIKSLLDATPHLRPAVSIISPLLRVSEVARDAIRRQDSLKGNLIAFGNIQSHSRNRPIPVAAYVTGKTGSDLCITQVQKQKRGWDDDRRSWLEVPTLHGEQATWPSHGGPIQQIHIASNIQPGQALLAVRLLTNTTIIRPGHGKSSEEALASGISTNVLYKVGIHQTGGHSHVDVAFNPWFSQQIALVDTAGNFTVFEFSTRSMNQVARTWSNLSRKAPDDANHSINDGWAHVAWVLNLGSLAVCTRTSLRLYTIVDDDPEMLEEVDLGLSGAVPWVFDFLVFPGRKDHVCALTSTHIMVYRLAEKTASQKAFSLKFRVRHYKNPEDLSLRLTLWGERGEEGEEDVGVLLYSSSLGLMSCYRFTLSEAQSNMTSDHMEVLVPQMPPSANKLGSISSIAVQRVEMAHKPTLNGSDCLYQDARFFSALVAQGGIGVCQILFCLGADVAVPPLAWEKKLATSSFRIGRPDFVVEDSLMDPEDSTRRRVEPTARRARRAKLQPPPDERTIGLERVTKLLQSPVESTEAFVDVLASVSAELQQPDLDVVPPMRTLHSFAEMEVVADNVEECSIALERLFHSSPDRMDGSPGPSIDQAEHGHRLTLESIKFPPSLGLSDLNLNEGLSSVYDHTLATWITPLSETIPGRIRLAKARLCGQVAAQVVLASLSLRIQEPPDTQPSQEQPTQTQSQTQDIYSQSQSQRGPDHFTRPSHMDSSQPFQSSALPTPSQTPSITTASTHPSTFSAPEQSRLSKYTSFTKPPPPPLPRALTNVLAHWNIAQDIDSYDWMSTSRNIAKQDDELNEDMTESERRRAQRRAERHMKRQRKEAAASQARQIASSQAPAIVSASQPQGYGVVESQMGGIVGGSQFTGPGAVSQVEAGRFGGRGPFAPQAAGKKRRRQGF